MILPPHSFDLDYRPRTYFWPLGLKPHPLSSIKGANRRSLIAGVLADDPDADIPAVLLQRNGMSRSSPTVPRIHDDLAGALVVGRVARKKV